MQQTTAPAAPPSGTPSAQRDEGTATDSAKQRVSMWSLRWLVLLRTMSAIGSGLFDAINVLDIFGLCATHPPLRSVVGRALRTMGLIALATFVIEHLCYSAANATFQLTAVWQPQSDVPVHVPTRMSVDASSSLPSHPPLHIAAGVAWLNAIVSLMTALLPSGGSTSSSSGGRASSSSDVLPVHWRVNGTVVDAFGPATVGNDAPILLVATLFPYSVVFLRPWIILCKIAIVIYGMVLYPELYYALTSAPGGGPFAAGLPGDHLAATTGNSGGSQPRGRRPVDDAPPAAAPSVQSTALVAQSQGTLLLVAEIVLPLVIDALALLPWLVSLVWGSFWFFFWPSSMTALATAHPSVFSGIARTGPFLWEAVSTLWFIAILGCDAAGYAMNGFHFKFTSASPLPQLRQRIELPPLPPTSVPSVAASSVAPSSEDEYIDSTSYGARVAAYLCPDAPSLGTLYHAQRLAIWGAPAGNPSRQLLSLPSSSLSASNEFGSAGGSGVRSASSFVYAALPAQPAQHVEIGTLLNFYEDRTAYFIGYSLPMLLVKYTLPWYVATYYSPAALPSWASGLAFNIVFGLSVLTSQKASLGPRPFRRLVSSTTTVSSQTTAVPSSTTSVFCGVRLRLYSFAYGRITRLLRRAEGWLGKHRDAQTSQGRPLMTGASAAAALDRDDDAWK